MLCPFCREKDTSVVDSRPTEDGTAIRRRLCGCDRKEIHDFWKSSVSGVNTIKGNGKREPFDRDKISKSIRIATRKRPIDSETIEKFISKIVRNLEGLGESEIPTPTIGKFIMDSLSSLDKLPMFALLLFIKILKKQKILSSLWNLDDNKS